MLHFLNVSMKWFTPVCVKMYSYAKRKFEISQVQIHCRDLGMHYAHGFPVGVNEGSCLNRFENIVHRSGLQLNPNLHGS